MYHLDRRKNKRGQAVATLFTALSLTAVGGGIGFLVGKNTSLTDGKGDPSTVSRTALNLSPETSESSTQETDSTTTKLGDIQAELNRLDALGERLVEMAGLNTEEFDFKNPPPQGGPEEGQARDYTIKEIASELGSVVSLLKDRKQKLEILEEAIKHRDLAAKPLPSGWPVRVGYITSNYGFRIHPTRHRRLFHQGIDFAAPQGSPVVAVADGVVTFSGRQSGYGNLIEIRHADGYSTRYGHNSLNMVREGQTIHRGQQIGAVGATGTATGPHVHFEVLKDGEHEDPMRFAGQMPPSTLVAVNPGRPG